MELPLRFRGSGVEASNSTRSGVRTIEGNIAGRPALQETGCVNRQRSGEHKVPRSRASSAGPLRGGVLVVASALSVKQGIGLCRCGGGEGSTQPGLSRSPSLDVGDETTVWGREAEVASGGVRVRQPNNAFERPLAASARAEARRPAAQRER